MEMCTCNTLCLEQLELPVLSQVSTFEGCSISGVLLYSVDTYLLKTKLTQKVAVAKGAWSSPPCKTGLAGDIIVHVRTSNSPILNH